MLSSLMEEKQSVRMSPFLAMLWEKQVVNVSCTTIRTSAKSGTCTMAMSVYCVCLHSGVGSAVVSFLNRLPNFLPRVHANQT